MTLHLTGDPAADTLLTEDPFALLLGMLLDQQIAMEIAFAGPAKIRDRIGTLDPVSIAGYDPAGFVEVFRMSPAVHRFPGSMAARVQEVAGIIARDWNGDAASLWTSGSPTGAEILRRLRTLPGFGDQKARIFLALLGKRLGVPADGWREASAPYGEDGSHRSVADIVDADSLALVRETKRSAKAAAKKA
ncbi:HhH-GPD-type base excision DNA repair protein [Cryobacterium sp. PH31-AA6]|uniref:HhH-GPD-type base excision DNA repair protein n=1 Tax=Cryobacterium sp. PH31-AA6 TaxID=3046205 RepID=UPI0024BAD0FC|nr:HhH-GPD-type base excision DNA repair protein [Cryobacterium sp. PH31-AA6]MDJ0322909.1 HhH-GPD-type base excision DNA repair protein [Cryobacterium sp. PH31-AA6]